MEMIGFRYSVTGAFGVDFYQNGRRLCAVSSLVAPSAPVHIRGLGGEWMSPFDADSTLFPGQTRHVYRAGSDREECHLVYRGEGYELQSGADVYQIHVREGAVLLYAGQTRLVTLTRLSRAQAAGMPVPRDAQFDDMEAYYAVEAADGVPDAVLMAALAFPMLRFDG